MKIFKKYNKESVYIFHKYIGSPYYYLLLVCLQSNSRPFSNLKPVFLLNINLIENYSLSQNFDFEMILDSILFRIQYITQYF